MHVYLEAQSRGQVLGDGTVAATRIFRAVQVTNEDISPYLGIWGQPFSPHQAGTTFPAQMGLEVGSTLRLVLPGIRHWQPDNVTFLIGSGVPCC